MHRKIKAMMAVLGTSAALAWSAQAQPGAGPSGWNAHWIRAPWSTPRDGAEPDGSRPMPVFRREFTVARKPVTATVRIAGLGQYVLSLDGKPVSPGGLHQAWTDYRKTVTFDSYPVKLVPGRHVLGAMLGNGMYNVQRTQGRYTKFECSLGAPKLIVEMRMKFLDGKTQTIGSDAEWKVAKGPVTFTSTYGGEDFDARLAMAGWDRPGFDDGAWTAAEEIDGPGGKLTAAIAPDVKEWAHYAPVKVTEPERGKIVYDLGQNFAGVPRLKVHGAPGEVVKLIPGELLNADGTVTQRSSGAPVWWSYTLSGSTDGEEWAPEFGFYGFRYVQVETGGGAAGAPPPKIDSIEGVEWHAASRVTGEFESSDEMLNAIHALIVHAMHNNEMSLFTDCPHREKLGWLEETHLVAPGLMFNNDVRGLYAATERNIGDAQHADGQVPTIAPQYVVFGKPPRYSVFDDSPEWGSASVLGPWTAYRFYGDLTELARSYPVMQGYVKFLESKAKDGIVSYGLGDWYDIGPGEPGTSKNASLGVTGTLMLYEDAVAMSRIAKLLGHEDDAAGYATLAGREKDAFNAKFWDADKGWYDRGSQTANAMPLALGVVPEERRSAVLQHVVTDIYAHETHITTGEVGYPYLLRALMEGGRNDVVLAMLRRKDPPSYGSQLSAGATALTEAWDANPRSSQDHFMLGGAEEWFYRGLGGIDFDMSRKKDERITIHPQLVAGLDGVKCSYDSVLGKIGSSWRQQDGATSIEIGIPPGATATLVLPVKMAAEASKIVREGKGKGPQLHEVRRDESVVVYRATAGKYQFQEADGAQ